MLMRAHQESLHVERVGWRVPAGFVLAPVLPCGFLALGSAALAGQWNAIGFAIISTVTVSWAAIAVFGVPSFLMLRRVKKVAIRPTTLGRMKPMLPGEVQRAS